MTDTFGLDKETLEKIQNIDTSCFLNTAIDAASFVDMVTKYCNNVTEEITKSLPQIDNFCKDIVKTMERFNEVVTELYQKDTAARQMRGDVITSIIILDEMLEEIILKFYVKEEQRDRFNELFYQESFPTSLKFKLVKNTGLLNPYPGLPTNIKDLLQWRNIFAHSKHAYSAGDVELFYRWNDKSNIKNIQTLKDNFDTLFNVTISKLDKILLDINNNNTNSA